MVRQARPFKHKLVEKKKHKMTVTFIQHLTQGKATIKVLSHSFDINLSISFICWNINKKQHNIKLSKLEMYIIKEHYNA